VSLDPLRRRALLNGALATFVTLVVGLGIVAGVTARDDEPEASPTPSPSVTPPPSPACRPLWEIAQTANPGDLSNQLTGVTALSGGEAWAVGASGADVTAPASVLIERWNGAAWTAEEGPAPGTQVNELRAVDAAEPNDVWAVGRTSSGFGDRPLVLRYDGSAWLEMEVPTEITGVLTGVEAVAPDDVWVVGYTGDPELSLEEALVLHWDGLLWAVVAPGRATGQGRSALFDVEATAPDDLWAVGYLHNNDPLIVHYDGRRWTRSDTEVDGDVAAVEPVTPTDAWAVGTPIQRFDGSAWTETGVPSDGELFGVAAVGPSDVWAVGMRPAGEGATASLVMRFDGQEWTVVDGPRVPGSDVLRDVDALADGTVLAVGYRDIEAGRRTLAILGETCPSATA
jgi:hypothetical protein